MVDNAAALPGGVMNPGGPDKRPGGRRRRRHDPDPRGRRVVNPPQIDIVGAASPVQEAVSDVTSQSAAIYSTGAGSPEMYHYDRQRMSGQEQTANQLGSQEVAQVRGPGSP